MLSLRSLKEPIATETLTQVVSPEITKEFLAKLASPSCRIKVLKLHDRPYSFKELRNLCRGLKKNTSVEVLDLAGIFVAEEFWRPNNEKQVEVCKSIACLLLHNRHLQEFILDGNPISNVSALLLAKAFAKSPLQRISLSFCDFESISGITEIVRSSYASSILESLKLNTSITLYALRAMPFQLLALYEKFPTKMVIDEEIEDYFKTLTAERRLIFSKPVKVEQEEFPVIYSSLVSPTHSRPLARTIFPQIDESKRHVQVPETKGVFLPGWSPAKFPAARDLSTNKFAEENKKNKGKKEVERLFFSFK